MRFARRGAIGGLALSLCALCAACLPLPLMPGQWEESRQNIGDAVPAFIVAGQTTRADVLLALGEADFTSDRGMQLAYTQYGSKGGVALLVGGAAGNAMAAGVIPIRRAAYRRLVLRFDEACVVTQARLETTSCFEGEPGTSAEDPCKDPSQRRRPVPGPPDAAATAELARGRIFSPALWEPGVLGFEYVQRVERGAAGGPVFVIKGRLVVGESMRVFFPPESDRAAGPYLSLPYAAIAEVFVAELGRNRALVIRRVSGGYETFSVGGILVDRAATEAAAALIQTHLRPAAAIP